VVPKPVVVAGRSIGPGQPCFLIAEAGVNHNGDLALARALVDAAVDAGADAVKFQTFQADRLVTADAPKADYQKDNSAADESQYAMLRRLELSQTAHQELAAYCKGRILFMSTPFDEQCADFLAGMGVPLLKIPSGEITNLPYLAHVARLGKPLILSTGMASLGEVESAVRTVHEAGNALLVLLHCVSNYPADPADCNLRAMATMAAAFGHPVGYSDHTLGLEVALAAVALGACVIEKHFTLDRTLPGPDHRASLTPDELASLAYGIRTVEAALGHGRKEPAASEADTARVARKSLVACRDILRGTVLTCDMIRVKRPGTGLPPAMQSYLVGRAVRADIKAGTLLTLDLLA
jgi:N-acetylneuraminate synthase